MVDLRTCRSPLRESKHRNDYNIEGQTRTDSESSVSASQSIVFRTKEPDQL